MPAAIVLTKEEEEKICELYKSGVSFRRMWKEYNYTQGVARKVLVKNGIEIRDRLEARAEVREKQAKERKFVSKEKGSKLEVNTNKEPIDCNAQGKRCIYKLKVSGGDLICNYLCSVGHSRGCDPTKCTKYSFSRKRGVKRG